MEAGVVPLGTLIMQDGLPETGERVQSHWK